MKGKKLSKLKFNIWFYLIIFALLIVVTVWIFQILLFDTVYQQKKLTLLKSSGEELAEIIDSDEDSDTAVNNWLSKIITANEAGILTYFASYDDEEKLMVNNAFSIAFANAANGNEDVFSAITEKDKSIISYAIASLGESKKYVCDKYVYTSSESYFYYITKLSNESLSGYLVLVSSLQTLSETVQAIQTQLIIDSLVVIVVSFFVAMYIATRLSKPIVEMSDTAKKWASGDENVVFYGNDFEELKELADTLNNAKESGKRTAILQRDLLANVSHDLKTPLTMIKAYAEMIRDISGDVKEKRDKHTKVIIDETDRLTMLVNDILDLSKLQNGMSTPDMQKVNLSELLDAVLFRMTDFAKNNGFTIVTDIENDLYTICDRSEIEQVFYNLIGNSINYTGEDKSIKVTLKRRGNIVLFETIDTGKGISEEKLPTIWEKYYRYSETHQRPIKGTGLGLSIVKTILEAHGLKFGVVSKKDVGSNFFVEFVACDG